MALIEITYGNRQARKPRFWIYALLTTSCFYFWERLSSNEFVPMFWMTLLGFVVGTCIWIFVREIYWRRSFSEAKKDFSEAGNNVDFFVQGQMLVAEKSRKIAFVDAFAGRYDTYDLNDIRTWKHTWVDKMEVASNAWGDKASGHIRQAQNILVITTTNPQRPIYKIRLAGHTQGEIWMARLEAIINGYPLRSNVYENSAFNPMLIVET